MIITICQLIYFFLQSDYIDVDGTPKQKQYLLQHMKIDNYGMKKPANSYRYNSTTQRALSPIFVIIINDNNWCLWCVSDLGNSSDGIEFEVVANRALVYSNEKAFVRAQIEVRLSHPVRHGLQLHQKFNIEDILSDAILGNSYSSFPLSIYLNLLKSTEIHFFFSFYDLAEVYPPISPEYLATLVGRK